jgi:hypothetical protein
MLSTNERYDFKQHNILTILYKETLICKQSFDNLKFIRFPGYNTQDTSN